MESKFQNIMDNYINGNFSDVKKFFFRLRNDDKLTFITWLKSYDGLEMEFRFDLLAYLLRKKIDK